MAETTTYIVLRRYEARDVPRQPSEADLWQVEGHFAGASAEAAIRLACKTDKVTSGTYVAVPARSWRPVTVQAVQTTVLKLEEATTTPPAGPS